MCHYFYLVMSLEFNIYIKIFWSIFVSIGFASLFNTPRRALWAVGLLGAVGFGVKTILVNTILPHQVIIGALIGASVVGISGTYFAHRVHTPPIVFTIPAVINMLPGKLGYQFMLGMVKIISYGENSRIQPAEVLDILNQGFKCFFIILALVLGIAFPLLIFNTYSVKNKDLHMLIRRKLLKKKHNNV